MRIIYIEHSGFLVETEEVDFLFDYYKGDIPDREKEKPLVVFVSHKHQDHYNPVIFEFVKTYPNIRYVLSKDVPVKREMKKYKEQRIALADYVTAVSAGERQCVIFPNGISICVETFKSTDEGVAFLVEYRDKTIYHAGDLNLWLWEGESEQYNENMKRKYFTELEKLKGRAIDVAFVPLDPRQEKDAFAGMESFFEYTESKHVFPMHFWENYGIIEGFLHVHPEYEEQIKRVNYAGQNFII